MDKPVAKPSVPNYTDKLELEPQKTKQKSRKKKYIDTCILGSTSDIAKSYIKIMEKNNTSLLLTSRNPKEINDRVRKLDVTNIDDLNKFQSYLFHNRIVFSKVIYFIGVHDKERIEHNIFVNHYSLLLLFSILINHMNKKSIFTSISSNSHKLHAIPFKYIQGYSKSKLLSLTFLHYIKDKVKFKIYAFSPPFTDTKIIDDKKYLINKIEHLLKKPKHSDEVALELYKFLYKDDKTHFYQYFQKPQNMNKLVYNSKYAITVLNDISTFMASEKGEKYQKLFYNLQSLLCKDIYLKLIKEQLYFQIQDFNLIDQHKHTGEIIKLFNKHETNSTKIILNIKEIKVKNLELYQELLILYQNSADFLNKKHNLGLYLISINETESIDVYYYPKDICIKEHVDFYQDNFTYKFNIIIASNKKSPMYIKYNKLKIYPNNCNAILFKPNILTHGVDYYKDCNRYILQFCFKSDVYHEKKQTLTGKIKYKHSKLLRKLEKKLNINNNTDNKIKLYYLLILVICFITMKKILKKRIKKEEKEKTI